jgi:predicted nucleotidyltransferase component of viral defense system
MDNFARFITPEHFHPEALGISCKSLNFRQPSLFETCLHAFELLGRLSGSGLPFLFKGGTSMVLHSAAPRRISTDIDIMTPISGEDLVAVLQTVAEGDPFLSFDEHDRGLRDLPNRRHFRYYYRPATGGTQPVPLLLDVVEDDFSTFETEDKSVLQSWFTPNRETTVKVQTLDYLLGDKLAAFAPRTTGVPYLRKDGTEGDLMQIAKQFFDVATLFDLNDNPSVCLPAWQEHVKKEAAYRELKDLNPEEVLKDTFQACLAATMITFPVKRRHRDSDTLWKGINSLANHVVDGALSHRGMFEMAGKVAYLTTLLGTNSSAQVGKPQPPDNPVELKGLKIEGPLRFLNPIGGSSPNGLFFWNEAAKLAPDSWIKVGD